MKNKSKFPKEILDRINEQTKAGFMLFYIDGNGEGQFEHFTDDSISARGLLTYVIDVTNALREYEQCEYQVLPEFEDEEDGEEFNEFESED